MQLAGKSARLLLATNAPEVGQKDLLIWACWTNVLVLRLKMK